MTKLQNNLPHYSLLWSLARTAHFALIQRSLPILEYVVTRKKPALPPNKNEFIKDVYGEVLQLLRRDSEEIKKGTYPVGVLKPENPLKHWKKTLAVLRDGVSVARRRKDNNHDDIVGEALEQSQDFPDYYKRNFHFQTDGYFSPQSAQIYDNQVEILFAGAADAMRRLVIRVLKEKIPGDGKGLHFLELGVGTGRLTRFMKLAYPKARITVIDPSDAYLTQARDHLRNFSAINFLQGFAEEMVFKKETFDGVYSSFLFHEIPLAIRRKVLSESLRVLKPGGAMAYVDALQLGDNDTLEWGLKQFPKDFHEPFFTDFIKHPMESLFNKAGLDAIVKETGFFSKAVVGTKPREAKISETL